MNEKTKVLIIEDEVAHGEALAEALEEQGHTVLNAAPHVVVTDLKLGGKIDGLDIVHEVVNRCRHCEVILITAHSSIDTCKTALRDGVYDYIEKPIDLDLFRAVVNRASQKVLLSRENEMLHDRLDEKFGYDGIVGDSRSMLRILDKLQKASKSTIPVLLTGETGSGKELLAAAIHNNSPRKTKPFQAVNCAGLSDTLLEKAPLPVPMLTGKVISQWRTAVHFFLTRLGICP